MSTGKIAVAVGVVGVLLLAALANRPSGTRVKEVDAVLTYVDPATRTLAVKITDPSSNAPLELSGEVPADCDIRVNDDTATLADLHAGDKARIRARLVRGDGQSGRHPIADSIYVTR